jgi:hypothetical protein
MTNLSQTTGFLRFGLLAVLLAVASAASAQSTKPSANDKASNGQFVGLAFVTDDANWYLQFERPETPKINGKDSFKPGERGSIATIFSGAEPRDGKMHVDCEITAFEPNGERKSLPPGKCYEGPARPPGVLTPSLLDLNFAIGPNDIRGIAGFEIIMRDKISGRSVKLEVSFMQDTAI